MEKRIIILIFFVFIIMNVGLIFGLGVSPPKVELNYKPYAKYSVGFRVISEYEDRNYSVQIEGGFSDYMKLDKNKVTGSDSFYIYIDLPGEAGTPGKRHTAVRIREEVNQGAGIGASVSVVPVIIIKVPYPGKYAQISLFEVSDTNEGESFSFNLKLENLGSEEIEPSCEFQVYMDGELLDKYDVGRKVIPFDSYGIFEKTVSVNKYSAGSYEARAVVKLNDINRTVLMKNTTLRIGSLNVEVINWTREAYKGKINPYNVEVESLWNNKINSIYAEVNVTNSTGESIDFFKTSPVTLNGWEKGTLNGFFNSEELELGDYNSHITIFYENLNKSKTVPVKVIIQQIEEPEQGFKLNLFMIIAIVIVVLVIGFIIFIIIKRKKNEKKEINKKAK